VCVCVCVSLSVCVCVCVCVGVCESVCVDIIKGISFTHTFPYTGKFPNVKASSSSH